jgi:catalase (peroxidase I)
MNLRLLLLGISVAAVAAGNLRGGLQASNAWIPCPGLFRGTPRTEIVPAPSQETFAAALEQLDVESVRADITKLLTDSQQCWPADFGNYVGLFTRLAWHSAGTFRKTDGEGGIGGGRQRFGPEANWEDNTNLDKARALVAPIKEKYGDGLSWADLFALAGTQAMWVQGTPFQEFCFGRYDDDSGVKSLPLGPSMVQEKGAPCAGPANGDCQANPNKTALAVTTLELIYVNPEGPMAVPDPAGSAKEIRTTFEKMGHSARSTVALIGGGHAFGKAHGACSYKEFPEPAGLPPQSAYSENTFPWIGTCPATAGGTAGVGNYTWTSGIEGPWTSTPTRWSNEFFTYLIDKEWEVWSGPGGKWQWRMKEHPNDPRMRMTTDIALLHDPEYKKHVEEFASNITALDEAFDAAWTQLISNGKGWLPENQQRCVPFGPSPDYTPPPAMLGTDITYP